MGAPAGDCRRCPHPPPTADGIASETPRRGRPCRGPAGEERAALRADDAPREHPRVRERRATTLSAGIHAAAPRARSICRPRPRGARTSPVSSGVAVARAATARPAANLPDLIPTPRTVLPGAHLARRAAGSRRASATTWGCAAWEHRRWQRPFHHLPNDAMHRGGQRGGRRSASRCGARYSTLSAGAGC